MIKLNPDSNKALNDAATAVRAELVRLKYLSGHLVADGEDKAIACAAIRAFAEAMLTSTNRRNDDSTYMFLKTTLAEVGLPETYSGPLAI